MKVTRILHASVNVGDEVDAATAFYRDVLGLPDEPRPESLAWLPGSWLRAERAQVHLVGGDPGSGAIRPTDHHVCFGVPDIEAAVAELEERGIEFARIGEGAATQIFVADPGGNTVELQPDPDAA